MSDYLSRAEDLHIDLKESGETMSDSMFIQIVLKGLPKEYDSVVTLLNYSEKAKTFDETKQMLINYYNDHKTIRGSGGSAETDFHAERAAMKCFTYKCTGHRQRDCPD